MDAAERRKRKSRRLRRERRIRLIWYTVLGIWGIFGIVGIASVAYWIFGAAAGTQVVYGGIKGPAIPAALGRGTADTQEDEPQQTKLLSEEDRSTCKRLLEENPALLVIANKDHGLSRDYDPDLRYICSGRLQAASAVYDDLVEMLAAGQDAGYEFWIASGYRSSERQQELIDEDVRSRMRDGMSYEEAMERVLREKLPAGHSEHETGLSFDILCSGNMEMDGTQADEPGNRWLVEHCSEFGFILRYPADKEDVTGITYEPWHFRYVGRDAAGFMEEKGLTLEEFTENAQCAGL